MPFHHQARLWRGLTPMVLFVLLVFAANGCGSRDGGSSADHASSATDSTAMAGGEQAQPTPADQGQAATSSSEASKSTPAAEVGVVRLVDKGCVQFEPHWVTVAPGQSITWVSELETPVTVHVDAGAFAKTQFTVRPGARVTSGPAGTAKDYKVWTEPNACQGAPLGARGAGPGIEVSASH